MAEEKKLTDEMMARQNIFGENVEVPEVVEEPEVEQEEEKPEGENVVKEEPEVIEEEKPQEKEEKPESEPEEKSVPEDPYANLDLAKFPEDKTLELINTKFSSNFDNIDKAVDFFSKQTEAKGALEIINKLTEKLKENSNILAHFPNENAYRVAQLAKDKYHGKESVLMRVVGSDVAQISDFEAIRLAQELKSPPGSKVDGLKFQLAKMGLRELDVSEFEDWDEMDKQLVYGLAEEAKSELAKIGKDIEIPSSDGGVDEFVSELQRGVAEAEETQKKQIEAIKPIAESLIENTKVIKPVEGDDFEYQIELDSSSRSDLLDYLTLEAFEGKYDLKSDADIKKLQGMLNAEIMATEYSKAFTAYGKYREEKVWAEAQKKYENAEPLDDTKPPAKEQKVSTDEDAAQRLLLGR